MQLKFLPRVAAEEEDGAGRQIFVYLDAVGHSHRFTASAEALVNIICSLIWRECKEPSQKSPRQGQHLNIGRKSTEM